MSPNQDHNICSLIILFHCLMLFSTRPFCFTLYCRRITFFTQVFAISKHISHYIEPILGMFVLPECIPHMVIPNMNMEFPNVDTFENNCDILDLLLSAHACRTLSVKLYTCMLSVLVMFWLRLTMVTNG